MGTPSISSNISIHTQHFTQQWIKLILLKGPHIHIWCATPAAGPWWAPRCSRWPHSRSWFWWGHGRWLQSNQTSPGAWLYPEDTLKQSGPGSPLGGQMWPCGKSCGKSKKGDASKAHYCHTNFFWGGENLRSHINSTKVAIACHSHIIYIPLVFRIRGPSNYVPAWQLPSQLWLPLQLCGPNPPADTRLGLPAKVRHYVMTKP